MDLRAILKNREGVGMELCDEFNEKYLKERLGDYINSHGGDLDLDLDNDVTP